jgi:hypothetical protein
MTSCKKGMGAWLEHGTRKKQARQSMAAFNLTSDSYDLLFCHAAYNRITAPDFSTDML